MYLKFIINFMAMCIFNITVVFHLDLLIITAAGMNLVSFKAIIIIVSSFFLVDIFLYFAMKSKIKYYTKTLMGEK